VIGLGLKVVFKYTRRKTAIRVFSVIYFKHSIVKIIKTDHLKIKAKYRFRASFFGLLAI